MPSQKGDTFRVTGSANIERCGYQGTEMAPVMSKDSAMNTDDGLGSPEPTPLGLRRVMGAGSSQVLGGGVGGGS